MLGKIHNPDKNRQAIIFDGLQFGDICLTDIDGIFDCKGRGYIFHETKTAGAPLTVGQRILFTRLANDLAKNHIPAIVIVSQHDKTDPNDDVILKDALVTKVKVCHDDWVNIKRPVTVQKMQQTAIAALFNKDINSLRDFVKQQE